MSSRKCAQCGLVNFAANDVCRRCGAALAEPAADAPVEAIRESGVEPMQTSAGSRVGGRLLWLAGVTVFLIFCWSRSLLLTSEPVDANQRQLVMQAIRVIDASGFPREATMLRNFANFRSTDNWWNLYLGHREAYAATNFPLGVVTLYPPFFQIATDDTERAAILFHEAQHLMGAGEESALARTWREKARLGWTVEKYGQTRVWRNTSEWTAAAVVSSHP